MATSPEELAPGEAEIIAGTRPMELSSNPVFRFGQRWNGLPRVPVNRAVRDGQTVAGFRVMATPGHSLGHTSLLSEQHGLLMTADAFGAVPR